MKNWEIIDGEYTRKVMWINHEIEMKLYYNGEDEIDGEEVDESKVEEMVEKILGNKDYWDKKCKKLFADEFVDWFNEEKWVKPEYSEIYYETKSTDKVEKELLKIIGKEDTEKIMKNNLLTKEAFKKLLDNQDMGIIIDYCDGEEDSFFTIAMHEKLFFVDKMFYACCNFNGEIDEYYMD
ncbi:hypothetical protein HMPREF1984_01350 [Leptotrichia sp. oral taxon 215 str. W9775]|uniref:hypothetical protein n=1 Tax=Leptotrichia sp. oral taxon 215 TaxID=712359 RepID=UPI0003AD7AEE|nr:hypothetical protein [Leptotrichia sp. oral taxon 215]ERK67046.1 hypothetical protein HMPREF1984_01350 [Leptotrichia sp. oral taxon 215 str. W9775]